MQPEQRIYHLTEESKAKQKRQFSISLVVSHIAFIVILLRPFILSGYKTDLGFKILIAILIPSLIIGAIYNLKKHVKRLETKSLQINEYHIETYELGKPNQIIRFEDIRVLKVKDKVIELTGRFTYKKTIILTKDYEDFTEIQRLIEDKVSLNQPLV